MSLYYDYISKTFINGKLAQQNTRLQKRTHTGPFVVIVFILLYVYIHLYCYVSISIHPNQLLLHYLRRMKNNAHAPMIGAMAIDIKDIW